MEEVQSHVLQRALLLLLGEKSNHETADTQLWWKRGQHLAQGCLSHQLMEESLFRSRHGSRSLLNSSNCVAQIKSMSKKLLKPSQSWLIRCGPSIPRMRHIFCAPCLPYWSVECPRNFTKEWQGWCCFWLWTGMAWEWGEERNTRPGAIRASLCLSISRIQAWSPAYGKTFMLVIFVCVLRAPLKTGSWHLILLLLESQVLGLANLQCGASIFQFLDGKVHLYC